MKRQNQEGVVALEFLFVFPLVLAMLYAAAAYGVLFFSKYEMQSIVDRAAATALRIDRNRYSESSLGEKLVATASAVMTQGRTTLSARLQEGIKDDGSGCAISPVGELQLMRCSMTLNNREPPIVPQLGFGLLGQFPPMPVSLTVEASIAF
ncbi:TadE/TadG family type IV pilus assembly protein [Pseudomonas sp. OIL-1]|uniref:TadE/TadG family type IV pilus assembly protein n=1 Tax=Pseudomonas sp. OIL-1 TaxID=2706126 RepID=UPI0013A75E02|nr:TadE/TadG family type IV pilus assembly protein [Pseudomonas sp. OIL-1]QIB52925.1 hypothetical protein G3M63_18850 [Pseudomonas sp. OIL-1]